VLLAHDHVEMALPAPVQIAELGVLVPVGLALLVLHVEQLQGHARTAQLTLDQGPFGQRSRMAGRGRRRREQPGLEFDLIQPLGQRPAETGPAGPIEVVGHGRVRQAQSGADLAPAQAFGVAQTEDLADLAHGGTGA
jgi:hypothetical protein